MQKRQKKESITLIVIAVVLIALVSVFIGQFNRMSRRRIVEQNQQYLVDATRSNARVINELFSNAAYTVQMVSSLYSKMLEEDGTQFDYSKLDELSDGTSFDFMRFVDTKGFNHTGSGEVIDATDRDYYIRGIRGESGVSFVMTSRHTNARMLAFYTPFVVNGEITGVLVGAYDESHLRDLMTNSYFDVASESYLCLRDGTVIGSSVDELPDNIYNLIDQRKRTSPEDVRGLREAMDSGMDYEFYLSEDGNVGNACMISLENSDWVLLEDLPPVVGASITSAALQDAHVLQIELIAIFVICIVFLVIYYFIRSERMRQQASDYEQIVDSVMQLYERFAVLDLEHNGFEYLGEVGKQKLAGAGTLGYDNWRYRFAKEHIAPEDEDRFLEISNRDSLRRALQSGSRIVQFEFKIRTLPGEPEEWNKYSVVKIDRPNKPVTRALVAVEDVTELKKRDEQKKLALERAVQAAEVANVAKRDFLSNMSHDIRTPLNAIIGLTDIALSHMDDSARVVSSLTKISSSGSHLLSLINDVLDMSQIESGKMVLANEPLDITRIVRDAADLVLPSANAKSQTLTVSVDDCLHRDVLGDSLRLRQVLVNILNNAVKYTGEGGTITAALHEMGTLPDGKAHFHIIVEDNGRGMTPEFLEKIFEPFERAEETRESVQGTGLGMPIVKNVIEAMGGTVDVESVVGQGTMFMISVALPIADRSAHKQPECDRDPLKPLRDADYSGKRALIAEDNEINLEIAEEIISTTGMTVVSASNGREALDRFMDSVPGYYSVIFMDIQMPIMDGYQATREIRSMKRPDAATIPIIAMTANAFAEDVQDALAAGMNAHVAKPLDIGALLKTLGEVLGE